jgi:L-threonylcarbamoyladenylate synthase
MAARALMEGHLVAFPTETVYGLGADALNETAVARIYEVKGRPKKNPLIVHISSADLVEKWVSKIPAYAEKLASKFWPGPMTLIFQKSLLANNLITGNQNSIGIRVPNQKIAQELLVRFEILGGHGIAAPSANRYGAVSPTSGFAVHEELGAYLTSQDYILSGGYCDIGIESTIIDCTKSFPAILRPGAVTKEMIQEEIRMQVTTLNSLHQVRFPGMSKNHYSPRTKVITTYNWKHFNFRKSF